MAEKKPWVNNLFKVNLLIRKGEKPQLQVELLKWLLSSGRFIVVLVELVVIGAFVYRYKLDADLSEIQDKIKEQIPYIQSLQNDEIAIRKTQFQLATIKKIKEDNIVFEQAVLKIAKLTPLTISLNNITIDKAEDLTKTSLSISGSTPSNFELSAFIKALQKDPYFSNITLTNISFEGQTVFTITGEITGREESS